MMSLPKLTFSNSSLPNLLDRLVKSETLIVADQHNIDIVRNSWGNHYEVNWCDAEDLKEVRKTKKFSKVIAVGGCSALDFGRACAMGKTELILIPTILSTSCISVNRSIVYSGLKHSSLKTRTPDRVVVSSPILMQSGCQEVAKWTSSGLGDLLSNISACIDLAARNNNSRLHLLKRQAREAFGVLDFILSKFESFDTRCLRILAEALHKSSLHVIRRDGVDISAAGEHDLYYAMQKHQKYDRDVQTHGRLVAIGTLITAAAWDRNNGENLLLPMLHEAYRIVGLPSTYKELADIHVSRSHIIDGLKRIAGSKTYLSSQYRRFGVGLVDHVYGRGTLYAGRD